MKTLPFLVLTSLVLAAAAGAAEPVAKPHPIGTVPPWVCPKNAICSPIATPRPIPPPYVCPPNAMCIQLPKRP